MDRPSLSARLRYAFDNYMSRGTGALILGLFGITVVAIVLIAAVVEFSGSLNNAATQGIDVLDLLWLTTLRTLDAGTMGGDSGTVVFLFAMLSVDPRRHLRRRDADRHRQAAVDASSTSCARGARG